MQKYDFDTTVRPQDDFFGFVNNHWLQANPIPKTETNWGTFYILRDQAWKAVSDIVKELTSADQAKLSHDQRLLSQFFTAASSYDQNSEKQLATLDELLDKIHRAKTGADIAGLLGYLHSIGINAFWQVYVSQDDKDSRNQVLRFYQAGLTLPNRDYYLEDNAKMKSLRVAYNKFYRAAKQALPERMLGCRRKTVAMETKLAEISWTDVALRDVQKNYTRLSLAAMSTKVGKFDWSTYWQGLGWQNPSDDIVVDQLGFMKQTVQLINDSSLEEIRAYLRWKTVVSFAGWLSNDLSDLTFDFFGKELSGQQENKPLWKRVALLADNHIIGEVLGREYAARHFPESAKQSVTELVEEIRRAYHKRIDRLTWMGDDTKKRAHTKLDNLKVFVGYPSVWKDLAALSFSDSNVLANIINARLFSAQLELAKIGQPPAEEDWEMNAHTVNAYHHPNRLEIVFPAAILQAPFYSPAASRAANLGGIGAVIGHELTHGFDDQGSEFDENGNTNPWQNKEERKAFNRLAKNIVRQADAFETVPGTFLQGKLILGEAIADVGGLSLAVEALGENSSEEELKDLFANFATCECGQTTSERAVELAKTDPHPPSRFRVNCVVNHIGAFYKTYSVTPDDKLYLAPQNRAKIW